MYKYTYICIHMYVCLRICPLLSSRSWARLARQVPTSRVQYAAFEVQVRLTLPTTEGVGPATVERDACLTHAVDLPFRTYALLLCTLRESAGALQWYCSQALNSQL